MSSIGYGSIAQQDVQLPHYMFDKLSVNPGYAGLNNAICGTFIGRYQWVKFDGAPRTGLLNVHMPVNVLRGGLGLTYYYDQLGFETNNIARLHYSFHKSIGIGTLGIGASLGLISKNIQATWITPDGTPWQNDGSISPEDKHLAPISAGVFFTTLTMMGLNNSPQPVLHETYIKTAGDYLLWQIQYANFAQLRPANGR